MNGLLHQHDDRILLNFKGRRTLHEILDSTLPVRLRRIGKSGQETLSEWRNMVVKGDNLRVLRTLCDRDDIAGQVNLIYIDPPFATGREFNGIHENSVAYGDLLRGRDFLEFLRERLLLIRMIMADDASIYVHIDWKMAHYVRVIMDEIFGPEHFINDITRIKCNPKNFSRSAYGNIKDTILYYAKGNEHFWQESREPLSDDDIERLFPLKEPDGRHYTTNPLHAPGETRDGLTGKPWRGIDPPKGRHWRYGPEKLDLLDQQGLIVWSGTNNPRKKIYAEDARRRGKKRQDLWNFKDPAYPRYPTEKNMDMMKTIIEASSRKGDLVLDAFAGSGTTIIAAEELGRRWIGIDNSDSSISVMRERLTEYEAIHSLVSPYLICQGT